MQSWPLELEADRLLAAASVATARAVASSPAGAHRAAAAFYDCLWLVERCRQHRLVVGRWSRRLVALRDQIEQYAEQGLLYVAAVRADGADRAASAGILEMLAALALFLEAAGRRDGVGRL